MNLLKPFLGEEVFVALEDEMIAAIFVTKVDMKKRFKAIDFRKSTNMRAPQERERSRTGTSRASTGLMSHPVTSLCSIINAHAMRSNDQVLLAHTSEALSVGILHSPI